MATSLDYAKIAYAAYYLPVSQYYSAPPGHMVDGWTVQHWKEGTLFSGFQGGIYQSAADVIVGCCGTNPEQKGKFVNDLMNDVILAVRAEPLQLSAAQDMVRMAKGIARGRRVSVTGHSLGGGLAQLAGLYERIPFVTFNAPAMARVDSWFGSRGKRPDKLAAGGSGGVNFRIRGTGLDGNSVKDLVSSHTFLGGHLGMVVDLHPKSQTGSHGKNTCWQAVLATDWWNVDPFGA